MSVLQCRLHTVGCRSLLLLRDCLSFCPWEYEIFHENEVCRNHYLAPNSDKLPTFPCDKVFYCTISAFEIKGVCITPNITQTPATKAKILLATGDCIRTCQNAAIFVLFVKFSLEVRKVRLRSPLPKIIKNIGVLVAGKSNGVFLG